MCVCVCVCVCVIFASIINIQVPHEVENQRAIAMRTSQIMKYEQNYSKWTDE